MFYIRHTQVISVLGVQVEERKRGVTSPEPEPLVSPTGRHIARATSVNVIPVNQDREPVEIRLHQQRPEKENIPVVSKQTGIVFHGNFGRGTPSSSEPSSQSDLQKELEEVRRMRTDEVMYKTHQLDPPTQLRIKRRSSKIYAPSSPPTEQGIPDDYSLPGIVLIDMEDSLRRTKKENRNSFIQFVSEETEPESSSDKEQIVPENIVIPTEQDPLEDLPEQMIIPSEIRETQESPYQLPFKESPQTLQGSSPLTVQGLKRKIQLHVTKKDDDSGPYKIRRPELPVEGIHNNIL